MSTYKSFGTLDDARKACVHRRNLYLFSRCPFLYILSMRFINSLDTFPKFTNSLYNFLSYFFLSYGKINKNLNVVVSKRLHS